MMAITQILVIITIMPIAIETPTELEVFEVFI
jgi:hypothetical protein